MSKIGIDVDGVLADFNRAYGNLTIEIADENKFPTGWREDKNFPTTWSWPEASGYSKEVMHEVWRTIKTSYTFWISLDPLPDFDKDLLNALIAAHETYFITARPGWLPKKQTEVWFAMNSVQDATVLISDKKGYAAAALDLDIYIDDKLENIIDVERTMGTGCHAYLINRPYNQDGKVRLRADNLGEVFVKEGITC